MGKNNSKLSEQYNNSHSNYSPNPISKNENDLKPLKISIIKHYNFYFKNESIYYFLFIIYKFIRIRYI